MADPPDTQRCRLRNGLELFCISPAEARLLYQDLFEERTYFKHGITIADGDSVLDVGANIGLFALLIHQTAPRARIHAFEPIPPIFDVLRANCALFGIDARLFPVGLSNAPGRGRFTYYPANSALSGKYADPREDEALARTIILNKYPAIEPQLDGLLRSKFECSEHDCELRTLSEVVRDERIERIDLLKIDVEKGEKDVFDGIDDADWPKIRQIVAEVHDIGGRVATLSEMLTQRGFDVVLEQHEAFRSTNIYDMYARRPS